MTHPLLDRLTADLGWPSITTLADLEAFERRPGDHCVFIPGDPARNLETPDAAVIVPEIAAAFGGRFDVALVADGIERTVRERYATFATPALVFVRAGAMIGAIPKIRDWDEYLARTAAILDGPAVAATH